MGKHTSNFEVGIPERDNASSSEYLEEVPKRVHWLYLKRGERRENWARKDVNGGLVLK